MRTRGLLFVGHREGLCKGGRRTGDVGGGARRQPRQRFGDLPSEEQRRIRSERAQRGAATRRANRAAPQANNPFTF
jgi:hypothetical protein